MPLDWVIRNTEKTGREIAASNAIKRQDAGENRVRNVDITSGYPESVNDLSFITAAALQVNDKPIKI